jgi:opacity protein-like surface antigen
MKRRNFYCAAGLMWLALFSAQAQYYYAPPAGVGPYFKADIGPSFFQDGQLNDFGGPAGNSVRYDTGLAAAASVGYAFNSNLSAGLEVGYNGAQIDSVPGFVSDNSSLSYVPVLVNATLSFPIPHTNIIPYVGAGVGFADAVFDTDRFGNGADFVTGSESDVVPAGQIFAGVRFRVLPQTTVGLGYEFFATGDPSFNYPPDNFHVRFQGARAHAFLLTVGVEF